MEEAGARATRELATWLCPAEAHSLGPGTQGCGARGSEDRVSLGAGNEGQRRPSCGGRARKALLSWEGFVYHHFLQIFGNNEHSVPTGLLRESLPYFKMKACLKIKFYLTST